MGCIYVHEQGSASTLHYRRVTSEEQYDEALNQVYALLQPHPAVDTAEGKRLNELVTRIERYEVIHYSMTKSKRTK